jgi:hypothetical protein
VRTSASSVGWNSTARAEADEQRRVAEEAGADELGAQPEQAGGGDGPERRRDAVEGRPRRGAGAEEEHEADRREREKRIWA